MFRSQTGPPGPLLDELKEKKNLPSDAKLAEFLGVSSGYICSIRKGRKGVSLEMAIYAFGELERPIGGAEFEKLFIPLRITRFLSSYAPDSR